MRPAAATGGEQTTSRVSSPPVASRHHLMIAAIALLGLAIMLYPNVAQWVSALQERTAIRSYGDTLDRYDPAALAAATEAAETYNADLRSGLIIDPFSNTSEAGMPTLDARAREYLSQLSLDPDGVMARIRIPKINVELPVFHGATEEVLRKGAGHLYGSSLPIGGESTHAVITAHAGLPEAALFTRLPELRAGDLFEVSSYDRTLNYRVTGTETVLPTGVQQLGVIHGKDLVTLVTCTPYGINTHRLLVHAERIDTTGEPLLEAHEPPLPLPGALIALAAGLLGWCALAIRALWIARKQRAAALNAAVRGR